MSENRKLKYALVLSGGGARGAYEAGVMYYIRTQLPKDLAGAPLFNIFSGTSVGAINSAFLAATAADPLYQGARLRELWRTLGSDDIYFADTQALAGFLVKTGFFVATNFFGLHEALEKSGKISTFPFRCVLNTTPFLLYLRRNVPWSQMHANVQRHIVDAITVSTTHMLSGHLTLFVEKHAEMPYRQGPPYPVFGNLSPRHILASAAIPLIFPIIRINRQFYGDGSLRQNTPMSPAIHLGADRILVVVAQQPRQVRPFPGSGAAEYDAEPALGDVLGRLLNSLFEDKLAYDLEQMRRINHLIDDFELIFGADALDKVNANRRQRFSGLREVSELKKVVPFVISPSEDLGALALSHYKRVLRHRESLNPIHRFFARAVESTPEGNNDFLSYLMFEPGYLNTLLDLGYQDARRAHDNLVHFFRGESLVVPEGPKLPAPARTTA
ncbi:MAG: patatin-like phospholipase family protein [Candidatus Lambdaproteobacteria bacterium]|nr:patatin-like phospholipase family protein [Candidatus Lambdaproteobacteria bacterium]